MTQKQIDERLFASTVEKRIEMQEEVARTDQPRRRAVEDAQSVG